MAVHLNATCDCKSSNIVIAVDKPKKEVIMQLLCLDCKSVEELPYRIGTVNG